MTRRPAGIAYIVVPGAIAAVVLLWILPGLIFPSPGTNDAPILWDLPMPIVAATLAACLAVTVRSRARHEPVTASVALGVYLMGVAVAFLVGLVTVANLQSDRFWPFLLSPVVFGAAGIAVLAVSLPAGGTQRELMSGALIGGTAAIFLAAWIVARGARDWLLAPYGFDVCLLIALEAVLVFIVSSRGTRLRSPVSG